MLNYGPIHLFVSLIIMAINGLVSIAIARLFIFRNKSIDDRECLAGWIIIFIVWVISAACIRFVFGIPLVFD